jgi:very-short-patch-repair endonuclease
MKNSKLEEHDKMLAEARERLISDPPRAQKAFERRLENARIDFDHEVIIGFYIADIVIPHKMLVIEIDGNIHDEIRQQIRDKWKDIFLYYEAVFSIRRIPNGLVDIYCLDFIEEFPDWPEGACQKAIDMAYDKKEKTCRRG